MRNYKAEAKRLINENKKTILPVIFFIALIGQLPFIFYDSSLSIVFWVLALVIDYGYIMTAKKIYRHHGDEVQVSEEGIAGIRQFTNIFSTYFFYCLFETIAFVIIIFLTGIGIAIVSYNSIDVMENMEMTAETIMDFLIANPAVLLIILLAILISLIFVVWYSLVYGGCRYLIDHHIRGMDALKGSRKMMKGHKGQLFRLELSFLPQLILALIVEALIDFLCGKLIPDHYGISVVIPTILQAICVVYLFTAQNQIALYGFYEDLIAPDQLSAGGYYTEYNGDEYGNDESDQDEDIGYYHEIEIEPLNNNDSIQYYEDELGEKKSLLLFEKISRLKLTLGTFLFTPFYLVIANYVFSILFMILAMFVPMSSDENVINSWYNLFYDGAMLLLAVIFFYDFFKHIIQRFVAVIKEHPFLFILKGYLITFGVSTIASMLVSILTHSTEESANQSGLEEIFGVEPIPIMICVILIAPILEEIIFRGLIFRFVNQYNRYLAHFISAFLFGFMHVADAIISQGQYSEIIQIIPYFAMGLVFSYFYDKYKTISIPICFHALNNLISVIIMML